MINEAIGSAAELDGRALWRTGREEAGQPVYGPYVTKTHGVYRVDFELALAAPLTGPGLHCATIEITDDWGNRVLAQRPVLTSELSGELRVFSLFVVLRQIKTLEFRVHVTGAADLLIGPKPVITRMSAIVDEPPRPDLGPLSEDLESFGRDTRRILRHLAPQTLAGFGKVRLGKAGDGGYICIDDLAGIDTAFSFGINDDISWDNDIAERGLTVYQFDHTVADPAPNDPRMIFEPKRIAAASGPGTQSLSDLIRRHDKGLARPNLILKMDIEGGEWAVLDATPEEELARLAWIVCELHYFQGLAEAGHRMLVDRALAKLGSRFGVVHIHSNVWGGYCSLANTVVPNVLEVTFANRAIYDLRDGGGTFPTALDQSCDPDQPDFYLGAFAH